MAHTGQDHIGGDSSTGGSGACLPPTPRETARVYRAILDYRTAGARAPFTTRLRAVMSGEQQREYGEAILAVGRDQEDKCITPALLRAAAEGAIASAPAAPPLRIGLQPGTFDPVHYGHLSMALAATIEDSLDGVLLSVGAEVPDKALVSPFRWRVEMTQLALQDDCATSVLAVTSIRQQVADMFDARLDARVPTGRTPVERRQNMDLAAFVWLFRANPHVTWTYIVGSDKVARFGPNDERPLIETLSAPWANARMLYFSRAVNDVDVAVDIEPYDWMMARWRSGFITKAGLPTPDFGSSTIRARIGASRPEEQLNLRDWLPSLVVDYISRTEAVQASYRKSVGLAAVAQGVYRAASLEG